MVKKIKHKGKAMISTGMKISPAGGSLKLAGQGSKGKKLVKGTPEAKAHMAKLRAMRKNNK